MSFNHLVHQSLRGVALVDASAAAAAGSVSLSWWYDAVRMGIAPKPAFRGNRFTRWRVSDVAEFWERHARSLEEASLTDAGQQAPEAPRAYFTRAPGKVSRTRSFSSK